MCKSEQMKKNNKDGKPRRKYQRRAEKPLIPRPKRALTAFNIFTGWERERILNGSDKLGLKVTMDDVKRIALQHKGKKKRQHRKSHGLITFQELSRIIANRWKELSVPERQLFEDQAAVEKEERMSLVQEWEVKEKALQTEQQRLKADPVVSHVVKYNQASKTETFILQQPESLYALAQAHSDQPHRVPSSEAHHNRSASDLDLTVLFSSAFEEEIMSQISSSGSNDMSTSSSSDGENTKEDSWNFSVETLPENVLGDFLSDVPLANVEIQEI